MILMWCQKLQLNSYMWRLVLMYFPSSSAYQSAKTVDIMMFIGDSGKFSAHRPSCYKQSNVGTSRELVLSLTVCNFFVLV